MKSHYNEKHLKLEYDFISQKQLTLFNAVKKNEMDLLPRQDSRVPPV